MSIGCMIWVFHHSQSSGNDRLVLLAIADEADDAGTNANPSLRRIATKANCHRDTATECVKRLEDLGELEVIRPDTPGRGRFNRYRIVTTGKVGNPDHSIRGSVEGSVVGSGRTQPAQNEDKTSPKLTVVRPFAENSTGSPQPERFRFGSVPEPYEGCGKCEGGIILDANLTGRQCECITKRRPNS